MSDVLEIPIVCQIPDDPTTVNTSVNVGIPLVMSMPNTKIARSILYLAERLLGAEQVKSGARRTWLAYLCSFFGSAVWILAADSFDHNAPSS